MKYWSRKKIVGGSAPRPITRIGIELLSALEPHGAGWPKLLRIGRQDSDDDVHRYEVDVELAPGLILPMEHGLTEDAGTEWNDPSNDEQDVVEWTMEGVEACLSDLEGLADRVHEARKQARSIVSNWREQGLPARVVDVHLAPYDHWRGDRTPRVRVLLETLDEGLEPVIDRLDDWEDRDLEATLDEAHAALSHRSARRDALMREGATGDDQPGDAQCHRPFRRRVRDASAVPHRPESPSRRSNVPPVDGRRGRRRQLQGRRLRLASRRGPTSRRIHPSTLRGRATSATSSATWSAASTSTPRCWAWC